jgi:hypothetical protein
MNRVLYENRCKCNEEFSIIKKRKSITRSEGKPLQYLNSNEVTSKIFQIKYEQRLSITAKLILNSLHNKYIYYAIDDILYLLKSDPIERENILTILYSSILSLQNNFSVNFFDIWIGDIYIDEAKKLNKFLQNDSKNLEHFSYITIKFFYKPRIVTKKQESLW